jgi:hypothetical protein
MSYKIISPLPVVEGGSGVQSNTAYAVICGGTSSTNPIQSIVSVGTSGQVLTSNGAGALPTFQTGVVGEVDTLTGNTGGAISPSAGNINVVGDATTITIAGAGSTLTASVITGSTFVQTLTGSTSGGAISPSSGNINITAGNGVTVIGSAHTLTIQSTGANSTYTNVNTTPYVVLSTDVYLSVDSSGGAITIQLPNAATLSRTLDIKDRTGSAATHNITVTTVGGAVNIDGATSFVMNTAYQSISVIGNASTYEVF